MIFPKNCTVMVAEADHPLPPTLWPGLISTSANKCPLGPLWHNGHCSLWLPVLWRHQLGPTGRGCIPGKEHQWASRGLTIKGAFQRTS